MPTYLTAEELAQSLQLSPETILQLARENKIPAIRLSPKIIRFDPHTVACAVKSLHLQVGENVACIELALSATDPFDDKCARYRLAHALQKTFGLLDRELAITEAGVAIHPATLPPPAAAVALVPFSGIVGALVFAAHGEFHPSRIEARPAQWPGLVIEWQSTCRIRNAWVTVLRAWLELAELHVQGVRQWGLPEGIGDLAEKMAALMGRGQQ